MSPMMPLPEIAMFIPRPEVCKRHEMVIQAPADLVFDVATHFDMRSITLVDVIFRLREMLLRAKTGAKRVPKGLIEEMAAIGWGVLAERRGRILIAGAACQPWQPDVVFTSIPPDEFAAYSKPGYVKIAWTLEAEALAPAITRFVTETRVAAVDQQARKKFRRYWFLFGIGSMAIRRFLLSAVRRRAEELWRSQILGCLK